MKSAIASSCLTVRERGRPYTSKGSGLTVPKAFNRFFRRSTDRREIRSF